MQEEINHKSIALTTRTTKLTGVALLKMIQAYQRHAKEQKMLNGNQAIGKQSLKNLAKKGDSINTLDMNDKDIRMFNRVMKKYGVDYAVTKNKSTDPPTYTIFFKAKDADVLEDAFTKFTQKVMNKGQKRNSVLEELKRAKEIVQSVFRPKTKTKDRSR